MSQKNTSNIAFLLLPPSGCALTLCSPLLRDGSHMVLELANCMYLWIDTKQVNASMHKFVFYQYIFWYLLSEWFIQKRFSQAKRKKTNKIFKEINSSPDLTPCHRGPRIPIECSRRLGFSHKAKRKTAVNNWGAQESFSSLLPEQNPLLAEPLETGWATCRNTEVLHLRRYGMGQVELVALHAAQHKDKGNQKYRNISLLLLVDAPTNTQFHFSQLFKSSTPHASANLSCRSHRRDLLRACWCIWPWQKDK